MSSAMHREAREAPEAVARFLAANGAPLRELGAALRKAPPPVIISSARGSSDNAAAYFKYLCEIRLGIPCASVGASVVSVYGAALRLENALCLTISQSGKSPDIVALQDAARRGGARTVAFVNDATSPAAANADHCLPLMAGPELSVAATKSFIVSLAAAAALVAEMADDAQLRAGVERLPEALRQAVVLDWPSFDALLHDATSVYVLGRGPSLPIAAETALKLKETCAIHAEAYSMAEVMHGPLEIVAQGFPVLVCMPADAALATSRQGVDRLAAAGAIVQRIGDGGLPCAVTGSPLLDPIAMVATAYLAIERLARHRGRDPDRPHLLKKVTETR